MLPCFGVSVLTLSPETVCSVTVTLSPFPESRNTLSSKSEPNARICWRDIPFQPDGRFTFIMKLRNPVGRIPKRPSVMTLQ